MALKRAASKRIVAAPTRTLLVSAKARALSATSAIQLKAITRRINLSPEIQKLPPSASPTMSTIEGCWRLRA